MDVEKQIVTYQNINYTHDTSAQTLTFNLTYLNASQKDNYRYTYNGIFVSLLNDDEATYRLSGTQKEWTYTPSYQDNVGLAEKTINHTTQTLDKLPEWNAKLNWGSILKNSAGTSITHTSTGNSNTFFISYSPAIKDTHTLTLTYYTKTSGGEGGGGGGGGGASPAVIVVQPPANETEQPSTGKSEVVTFDTTLVTWLIPYTPSKSEKAIKVKMEQGNIRSNVQVTENQEPYLQVATCDLEWKRCVKGQVNLNQGEEAYIYLTADWDEDFGNKLINSKDKQIAGWVTFNGIKTTHKIQVIVEAAPLYEQTHDISDWSQTTPMPVNEPVSAAGIYGGLGLSLIGGLWFILSRTIFI